MTGRVWCVRSRGDLWCAVADGKKPDEAATSVPTACSHFIILPGGVSRRKPNCEECIRSLGGGET